MDERLRALNRFGLGAAVGERDRIGEPRDWLRAQLDAWDGEREADPPDAPDEVDVAELLVGLREAQRGGDRERAQELRGRITRTVRAEGEWALNRRVQSRLPFVERLVAFWSNHLCVSVSAGIQVAAVAGRYEREVVRRHVLGRFEEMVLASARHPAMLFYLDNAQSIGPGSPAGRRSGRRRGGGAGAGRGLNENYARELLELHTLGVDGGYAQADVEALARILTGWTVAGIGPGARPGEPLGFVFRAMLHEPGAHTVLGTRYDQRGESQGEEVVRDLCRHPATARFVATKLVRHFVDDEPPPEAVDRIASTFLASHGDLLAVSDALVDLPEAWRPEHRKFRTPQDWVVAVVRATDAGDASPELLPIVRALRHMPWAPQAPKGYGDLKREWADPDALMNRAELATSVARRLARGRGIDPRPLLEVVDVEDGDALRDLVGDRSVPAVERVALVLASPAFQWR